MTAVTDGFQRVGASHVRHATDGYDVRLSDLHTVEYRSTDERVVVDVELAPAMQVFAYTLRRPDPSRALSRSEASVVLPRIVAGLHAMGCATEIVP